MVIIIGCVNCVYVLSLIITWIFYPAGPIYDIETDKITGYRNGVTWFSIGMLIPFSLISSWGFQ